MNIDIIAAGLICDVFMASTLIPSLTKPAHYQLRRSRLERVSDTDPEEVSCQPSSASDASSSPATDHAARAAKQTWTSAPTPDPRATRRSAGWGGNTSARHAHCYASPTWCACDAADRARQTTRSPQGTARTGAEAAGTLHSSLSTARAAAGLGHSCAEERGSDHDVWIMEGVVIMGRSGSRL